MAILIVLIIIAGMLYFGHVGKEAKARRRQAIPPTTPPSPVSSARPMSQEEHDELTTVIIPTIRHD